MAIRRSPEQAEVLDMVARLKKAAEQREASLKAAAVPAAGMVDAADELDFPPEFYQYFTVEKAA